MNISLTTNGVFMDCYALDTVYTPSVYADYAPFDPDVDDSKQSAYVLTNYLPWVNLEQVNKRTASGEKGTLTDLHTKEDDGSTPIKIGHLVGAPKSSVDSDSERGLTATHIGLLPDSRSQADVNDVSEIAEKRYALLRLKFNESDNSDELLARLSILDARMNKLSPRVSVDQVATLSERLEVVSAVNAARLSLSARLKEFSQR